MKVGDIVVNARGIQFIVELLPGTSAYDERNYSGASEGFVIRNLKTDHSQWNFQKDFKVMQQTEQFPTQWSIKGEGEGSQVQKTFEELGRTITGIWNGNGHGWYDYNGTTLTHGNCNPAYQVVTVEQLRNHYVQTTQKQETMSKIQGYICPTDMFDGRIPKGTLYVKNEGASEGTYKAEKYPGVVYQLPKEIVESWEVKKEEEFKKGDVVIIVGNTNHSINKIGDIGVISSEADGQGDFKVYVEGNRDISNWTKPTEMRKATQQEIEEYNKPKVGDWMYVYTKEESKIATDAGAVLQVESIRSHTGAEYTQSHRSRVYAVTQEQRAIMSLSLRIMLMESFPSGCVRQPKRK